MQAGAILKSDIIVRNEVRNEVDFFQWMWGQVKKLERDGYSFSAILTAICECDPKLRTHKELNQLLNESSLSTEKRISQVHSVQKDSLIGTTKRQENFTVVPISESKVELLVNKRNCMEEELREQMQLVYKIMASEEFANTVATSLWNLFVKLKEKGFSDEQATNLLMKWGDNMSNK